MLQNVKRSDPKIAQDVTQRLASRGIRSPSRVTVSSSGGQVTLSGNIQYEHQRQSAIQLARAIEGVKGVVDTLKLIAAPKRN